MVRDIGMSEATFAEIKKDLSNEHMTDLVLTIAFYCAVVRVLATMKIDNEPYYKEVLKQYRWRSHRPERSRRGLFFANHMKRSLHLRARAPVGMTEKEN